MARHLILLVAAGLILGAGRAAWAAAPKSIPLDGYAAVVNDKVITVGDVMAMVQPVEQQLKQTFEGDVLQEKLVTAYEEARNSLVERALILKEFEDQKGNLPESAVDDRVADLIRQRFNNDRAAFLAALAEERVTLPEWRDQIRDQIVVSLLRRKEVNDRVNVSPSAVRAAYEARRNEFSEPDKVKVRMIVLNMGATDEDRAVKKSQAEQTRARLEAGEDFSTLAKSVSEGSKASRGGDWGWIEPTILRPELAAVVAQLEPGRMSPVVEAGDEYYIILLEARQNAHTKPFEEVRDDLTEELRKQEAERLYQAWITRLKNKYYVKIF